MSGWANLWNDDGGSEDDEDYDPSKDDAVITNRANKEEGDSDSEDYEELREMLSPKKNAFPSTDDAIGRRTRTHLQLTDDADNLFSSMETQLERAEMVLDPMSPGGMSCDGLASNALTNKEYQHFLAVQRGQAEPNAEDDDEDDEDFIPGSDGEGLMSPTMEDELFDDETGLKVSRQELSDLIAENSRDAENSRETVAAKAGGAGQRGGAHKKRRKEAHRAEQIMSSLSAIAEPSYPGGGGRGAGGFTRDQCIQLQGQMRLYFQLAVQQYVSACSDRESLGELEDEIGKLYKNIAELYKIWEVTSLYSEIQQRAMEILGRELTGAAGGAEGVGFSLRKEPRFSFFDFPAIGKVPDLLQAVSDKFSREGGGGGEWAEAEGILAMFGADMFDPEMRPINPREARAQEAHCEGGYTRAEDTLLLSGLRRFGQSDWTKIHEFCLPTKSVEEIRARFRALVHRTRPDNLVKQWKLSRDQGLGEDEQKRLQEGVKFYGPRFDLIGEFFCPGRSEEELRKAYDKHWKGAGPAPKRPPSRAGREERVHVDVHNALLSESPSKCRRGGGQQARGERQVSLFDSPGRVAASNGYDKYYLDSEDEEEEEFTQTSQSSSAPPVENAQRALFGGEQGQASSSQAWTPNQDKQILQMMQSGAGVEGLVGMPEFRGRSREQVEGRSQRLGRDLQEWTAQQQGGG